MDRVGCLPVTKGTCIWAHILHAYCFNWPVLTVSLVSILAKIPTVKSRKKLIPGIGQITICPQLSLNLPLKYTCFYGK